MMTPDSVTNHCTAYAAIVAPIYLGANGITRFHTVTYLVASFKRTHTESTIVCFRLCLFVSVWHTETNIHILKHTEPYKTISEKSSDEVL